MYRIAVCDDEPLMAEENVNMARRILNGRGMDPERDYQIDAYLSPDPLMEKLTAQPNAYDLLLLDIELSGENGVELAAFLREKRFEASIIYVTGHAGFALDSFPTRPLDYLLKPVNEERLAAALDWDIRKKSRVPERPMLRSGTRAILLSSIHYLEIHGRRTLAHLDRGDEILPEPLSKLERSLLDRGFRHSHFSYLVNLEHVEQIRRTEVLMDSGERLPVSRSCYQELMNSYIDQMK